MITTYLDVLYMYLNVLYTLPNPRTRTSTCCEYRTVAEYQGLPLPVPYLVVVTPYRTCTVVCTCGGLPRPAVSTVRTGGGGYNLGTVHPGAPLLNPTKS